MMLEMCRDLGFHVEYDPREADICVVSLELG